MSVKKKILQAASSKELRGDLAKTLNNQNAYIAGGQDDRFGYRVSISDTYAIVGAYQEDDADGLDSGKAYIFNPSTGALLHTLDNPNPFGTSEDDNFGFSVSISDTYAIVGAYSEDQTANEGSGKAYIFNPSNGALLHTLDNPNPYGTSTNDYFGYSVSISDTYAIVGAMTEDDAGGTTSGKAYIFNPSTGALLYTLNNPNDYGTSAGDQFGRSVSISDTYAIVGAPFEDDAGGTSSGKAYIFNPSNGALLHTLDNPNAYGTSASDYFGFSVSISDTYAIVGAYIEDDAGGTNSGKAYIFNPSTGALSYTLDNPNAYGTSQTDYFGYSVSISDTYAIVGAYEEDDAGGLGGGKAYIFNPSTGALLHTLDNPNAYNVSLYDNFGVDVSISDTYAIAGAYNEDGVDGTSSGKAYIYDPSVGALSLLYTLDNPNDYSVNYDDRFGFSVSTSNTYAIVGAPYEDDKDGGESGKAYIYDPSTGVLLHTLDNPNPYSTSEGDWFGLSVSISDTYAIVGASHENDASGDSSGKAYIFNPSTGALLHTLDNPNPYGTSTLDNFGANVSVSNTYAIVSAYLEDDASNTSVGKAYIYNPSTGALLHTLDNPNDYGTTQGDYFGYSVSISETYAIVGAYLEDDASGTNSGKAYIFNPSTGVLLHTLDNPNPYSTGTNDNFGRSVSISETYAIVGAYREDDTGGTSSGKAYIFNPSTGALLHTLDNPNAYGTSASDIFGLSVSISDTYAIVGAYQEDDAGGTNSGKAYIFNPSTGSLLHTLDNPNADGTSQVDYFGHSVSISDTYAIVGAYQEDDADGIYSGKAYIFI
jgi:hypothetical protein